MDGPTKPRTLDAIERELLADPAVRAEIDALEPEFAIARALISARARAGLSQAEAVGARLTIRLDARPS